jgi:DNA invertase Pin-like site-specific DNA recombinase
MSTGVYIRVSSPKGQKTDSQRAELEAWLKRHRQKAVQWFEDRDSATNLQREAFLELQGRYLCREDYHGCGVEA